MKDAEGREVIARLAYPLPLDLAVVVMRGISTACKKAGWDAVVITDGPDAGAIAVVPRAKRSRTGGGCPTFTTAPAQEHPHGGPPPAEKGAPPAPTT